MIGDLREAWETARPHLHKSDFVVVLKDGTIKLCKTQDEAIEVVDNNEGCFVVKGEMPEKKAPEKKSKKD